MLGSSLQALYISSSLKTAHKLIPFGYNISNFFRFHFFISFSHFTFQCMSGLA
uniref:Uncharacterized protein n=1 Tax=Helianthus annuus TaxID=4232 RepID=A0A251SG97_HELAN